MPTTAEAGTSAAVGGGCSASGIRPPLPNAFLQHPGLPPVPFRTWLSSYRRYIRLLELDRDDFPDGIKKMLLFQLLWAEDMRQFGNEPAAACMDDDMLSFVAFCEPVESFFQKPVKPACACQDLYNCRQGQRESGAEFVTALQELLPDCRLDADHQKEHLAMQLPAGCHSDAAQKRMLLEDIINLDKYMEILLSEASAVANIATFGAAACATSTSSASASESPRAGQGSAAGQRAKW